MARPQEQREDQFNRDAALRVGDELSFVQHDEAELIQKARGAECEVEEGFVGEEAQVVASGQDGSDAIGSISAATGHTQTGGRITLGELLELFVDQCAVG
ncbi:hypothetical protein D9M68_895010 [compost metagenome]